jgi:hypothetical protein
MAVRKSNVTFGKLDAVLQALGFSVRIEKGRARLYAHKESGAVMSLPDCKPTEFVGATHFAATRHVLSAFGIADDIEFESQLREAS